MRRRIRSSVNRYLPSQEKSDKATEYSWDVLLFFIPFFRPFFLTLVAILFFTALRSLFTAFIPYSSKILIDSVFGNTPVEIPPALTGPFAQVINSIVTFMGGSLSAFITVVVLVGLSIGIMDSVRTFLTIRVREGFIVSLRTALFTHVLFVPIRFFRSEQTGSIISRVNQDTAHLQGMVLTQFPQITSALFTLIFTFTALFFISIPLTLIFVAILPFIWIINYFIGSTIKGLTYLELEELSEIFSRMGEAIAGIEIVKSHAAENREADSIATKVRELGDTRIGNSFISAFGEKGRAMVQGVAMLLILWLGGSQVLTGSMSVGDFIAFMAYLPILGSTLQIISAFPLDMQKTIAAGGRVRDLFHISKEYEPDDTSGDIQSHVSGEITFDHLSFYYDERRIILDDISEVIRPGEIVGVIGETGAGKTTLIQLIMRFFSPVQGRILLDGQDITTIRHDRLRGQISFVSQDLFLFHDTIRNNIRYSVPHATEEQIIAASNAAQIHETIMHFPDGYDTLVGERGLKLSAGQRQRISLARAFLRDAPVIIMDEPSSSLDIETEYKLLTTLTKEAEGKTVLIITHRESILKVCDRVLRLINGKLTKEEHHTRSIMRF